MEKNSVEINNSYKPIRYNLLLSTVWSGSVRSEDRAGLVPDTGGVRSTADVPITHLLAGTGSMVFGLSGRL